MNNYPSPGEDDDIIRVRLTYPYVECLIEECGWYYYYKEEKEGQEYYAKHVREQHR